MEKNLLPPPLEATLDSNLSLAELLQAHMAYAHHMSGASAGLLVRQIATNLHVDPRTINNWLKGRHRPHDEMIQDLVDTLSKLIPVQADVENKYLILEKQRRAIYSACNRREVRAEQTNKISSPKENPPLQPSDDLDSEKPAVIRRFKKKNTALISAMILTAFFSSVWMVNLTSYVNTVVPPPRPAAPATNSVLIGGFEEPVLSNEKPTLYFPKGTIWKMWGHNGGGIQKNHSGWEADLAPEGVQTAFLHSGEVHMSREIRIEPGTYNVSFYAARRRYGLENPNPVQILINGKECGAPITPANIHFQQYYSGNFTVRVAATYTIEIATRSEQADKGDTFLDKVELNLIQSDSELDTLKNSLEALGQKIRNWIAVARP